MSLTTRLLAGAVSVAALLTSVAQAAPTFVNNISLPGNGIDLAVGQGVGANGNRLGGFVSDLVYAALDPANNPSTNTYVFYGLSDRGPGGGTIAYNTRIQKFTLTINPTTGAISNFTLLQTILLTVPAGATVGGVNYPAGTNFNGLNPLGLNGNVSILGASFDPEGLVVLNDGSFIISDEYGPSVYRFSASGVYTGEFAIPSLDTSVVNAPNLRPKIAGGTLDYLNGRPTILNGRQDNRGFEGVTLSPDGTKIYALLQDPLVNEGDTGDGRRSRNLRLVQFDVSTNAVDAQYIYQVDSITDINATLPVGATAFTATNQGRSIGISSITAINDKEFIIIERDNRGQGVDSPIYPNTTNLVAQKRLYKISLTGATNVNNISLAGTNALGSVVPVTKTLFSNVQSLVQTAGLLPYEKLEGFTVGPRLADGSYSLILGTDNDYSVTQNGSNEQFDVCTDGTTSTQVPLDSACPTGQSLIPSQLYALKAAVGDLNYTFANLFSGINWTPDPYAGTTGTFFVDVTGDGKADALVTNGQSVTLRSSTGFNFGASQPVGLGLSNLATNFLADVTGDGRADLISVSDSGTVVRRFGFDSTIFSPVDDLWSNAFVGSRGTFFADVTGDGRADAIAVNDGSITIRRSNGSNFEGYEDWTTSFFGTNGTFFADVTGDGLADAIAVNSGSITIRRSNGTSFGSNEVWSTSFFGTQGTFFADVTGDGKADVVALNDNSATVRVSSGTQFGNNQTFGVGSYTFAGTKALADVTGDGLADLVLVPNGGPIVVQRTVQ